jgi:DNA-binding response OmpR family regulator
MTDDRDSCLTAGANDYIAKPLDIDKLLSLARVWMPK